MANIVERYGTVLRIYDNGGKTFDRYTVIPPRWAKGYRDGMRWEAIGASELPYHPQGFGMHVSAHPGKHLGARIHWDELPQGVKQFCRDAFPEYAPQLLKHCK